MTKHKPLIMLAAVLLMMSLLSGCSTTFVAFLASKQDDILSQINIWSEENEYGKAFDTIDFVIDSHPQYQQLQKRKKALLIQANKYERGIERQIQQFIRSTQWAKALDLLDQAKEKYPQGKSIAKTEKQLLSQQKKLLGTINKDITIERSKWLIKTRIVYREKLNTDPRNKLIRKQLGKLKKESKVLAQKLTILSLKEIDREHYKTAKSRIYLAIALESSNKRQKILARLYSRSRKSNDQQKELEDINRKLQQDTLLLDIEETYQAGDLLKSKQLIMLLDNTEPTSPQIIKLTNDLNNAINSKSQQLQSDANTKYTNGQFHQAKILWQQALLYAPKNMLIIKNIQRVNKVIAKLRSIRKKQQ